jgi:small multidrug resistance pump
VTQYAYLFLAVFFEVLGTSTLKATEGFTRPLPSAITLISYAAAFYVLSLTLKTIPVGIAYAIWAGFGVVLITFIGWIVYKQQLDAAAIIGISLILAGVLVVNLFSHTAMT